MKWLGAKWPSQLSAALPQLAYTLNSDPRPHTVCCGPTSQCNVHLLQSYQVFVKDFASLLPFLSVFLHSKNEELRHLCSQPASNEDVCGDILALFTSLSDIFQCWSTSQYFKREFQTSLHQISQQIKFIVTSVKMKSVNFLNGSGTYKKSPKQFKSESNFILLCLELLLPVADKLISKEDKPLMDACSLKLGMVKWMTC